MTDLAVRRAVPSDLPAAVALWSALHAEHERQDARYRMSDDAAVRWSADFRVWARSDADRIWLGMLDGGPVGMLTAHLYEPAPTYAPSRMVYVDDLYVRPAARGRGLGRALLDAASAWGRENGATELRAGVLARNESARAFWARAGAQDYSVVLTVPLATVRPPQ